MGIGSRSGQIPASAWTLQAPFGSMKHVRDAAVFPLVSEMWLDEMQIDLIGIDFFQMHVGDVQLHRE